MATTAPNATSFISTLPPRVAPNRSLGSSHYFVSLPQRKTPLIGLLYKRANCPTMEVTALQSTRYPQDPTSSNLQQPHAKLTIGIVGFGNFGQFLARAMIKQGHSVIATSRSDYTHISHTMGIAFFRDLNDFCEEHPDVILLCTSILSTESTLRALPFHRLKRDTLFVDVLSVKEFPRNLFLKVLPPECEILCTHPMFGPESGRQSWADLPFVFDKVRVSERGYGAAKCRDFLKIFEAEGCRMVEMSCAEHDRYAAGSQFITHTVGRMLSQLHLESTPINTKGYESLLRLTQNTVSDSFDLYYGLFLYNVNAMEQIEKLDRAFEAVKQNLYGRLRDILKKQLVEGVPVLSPRTSSEICYLSSVRTDSVPSSTSPTPSSFSFSIDAFNGDGNHRIVEEAPKLSGQ